jgi:hypothetical protein
MLFLCNTSADSAAARAWNGCLWAAVLVICSIRVDGSAGETPLVPVVSQQTDLPLVFLGRNAEADFQFAAEIVDMPGGALLAEEAPARGPTLNAQLAALITGRCDRLCPFMRHALAGVALN